MCRPSASLLSAIITQTKLKRKNQCLRFLRNASNDSQTTRRSPGRAERARRWVFEPLMIQDRFLPIDENGWRLNLLKEETQCKTATPISGNRAKTGVAVSFAATTRLKPHEAVLSAPSLLPRAGMGELWPPGREVSAGNAW